MPVSLYDEIQSLLTRALEQSPIGHAVFTEGKVTATTEEAVELLHAVIASQGQALLRIAHKVDELHTTIDSG